MSDTSLLPPNASQQERALALAAGRVTNVPVPIRELWNPNTCPADKLAWLAWAFGVDEWDQNWPDEFKRASIRDAVLVQQRKGSVWSVRQVLANAGYGQAQLVEGLFQQRYDGSIDYDGFATYGSPERWATYRVVLERPITNKQAAQVRRLLETTAPARCLLLEFSYVEANNLYNGAIFYNGDYNYGTV